MALYETPMELAQRHVAEGEERVARQRAMVAALAQQGYDTEEAEALLVVMQDSLWLMRWALAREQEHEASSSTDLMPYARAGPALLARRWPPERPEARAVDWMTRRARRG